MTSLALMTAAFLAGALLFLRTAPGGTTWTGWPGLTAPTLVDKTRTGRGPTVAIAHDYLTQRGGAERVVLSMLRAYPDATIYTTLYDPEGTYPEFKDARIVTSPLNRIGFLRRNHRLALPLLPFFASTLRVPADIVLTSSSGWAHGFRTDGKRVVYCHNPARWVYQTEDYLGGPAHRSPIGLVLLAIRPMLRLWDRRAARHAASYAANSRVVRDRIRRVYGYEAPVIHPPHSVDPTAPQDAVAELADWETSGYHLIVSRLLPYKNVHQAVDAFRGLPQRLVVVGRGPLGDSLRESAPDNVRILSDLTDAQLRWVYAHSTTLLAPSIEDFGLTPLEAGSFGRPTLSLRAGGYLDTVVEGVTGAFFDTPTPSAIRAAVCAHEETVWDGRQIRAHADEFSEASFARQITGQVAATAGTRQLAAA